MITIKGIIILIIFLVLIPYLLGLLVIYIMKDRGMRFSIPLSIVIGVFCSFILFYIPAILTITKRGKLTLLTNIWMWELLILSIISLVVNRKVFWKIISNKYQDLISYRKENWLTKILLFFFITLVFVQSSFLSYSNLYDTDDARYLAESLDAINTDQMLLTNPLTGESINEPIGEMTKDVICPFPIYQASLAKLSGIHPATLCHVILPLFLIPLCYLVYWLLSIRIFGGEEREKRYFFLVFICILMMFGRLSAFWNSAYLLWRIWQGKAILATVVIPFLFWIMQGIMQEMDNKDNYFVLLIVNFGACILTPMSAIFPLLIAGIYALLMWMYSRKAVILFRIGLCCFPMVMLLVLSKIIGTMRYGL